MAEPSTVEIVGPAGLRGRADLAAPQRGADEQVLVRLEDGRSLVVPRGALREGPQGRYELDLSQEALEAALSRLAAGEAPASPDPILDSGRGLGGEETVVPVIAEQLEVEKRRVETGRVRISKVLREEEAVVDEPLLRDEVVVERVAVNEFVSGPLPGVRREGEAIIMPVVEEVLVLEKRWMVTEEVRIHRRRTEVRRPEQVTLRREEVRVERTPGDSPTE